jgi:hypothetical protein
MLTPKRPRAAPESTKSKLSKFSSSSAASAKSSGLAILILSLILSYSSLSVAQYPPTRGRARGNRNLRTATRLPSPTHSTNTQHRCLRRLRDALAALAVLAALTSPPPSRRAPWRSSVRHATPEKPAAPASGVFVYVDWLTHQLIYIHIHTQPLT